MLLEQQQQQLIPTKVFYTEQQISVIINLKKTKEGNRDEDWEGDQNKNVEVKVEQIQKERIEMKKMEFKFPQQEELDKNKSENIDHPYQRIYSNASRRYRREEILDSDSKDEDLEDIEMEDKKIEEHQLHNGDQKESISTNNTILQEKQGEEKVDKPIQDEDMKNEEQVEKQDQKQEDEQNGIVEEENKEEEENEIENIASITYKNTEYLRDLIVTPLQRVQQMDEMIRQFKIIIPKVVAQTPQLIPSRLDTQHQKATAYERFAYQKLMSHRNVNQSLKHSNILFFPHKNLVQYDCGKLQQLAKLLKHLHSQGSKILIFTQMTRVLDILENFLNIHGYTYVRLDGSVKVEMRQKLVDKFNLNKKIFCFISSTRCGGIGINLTGADCVVFYDSDWNPAMDKQAQDRCHRIGQTKTVNIYRLISTNTIEENIFKKSLQKRELGGLIIEGTFDMEFFKKVSLKDILEDEQLLRPQKKDILKEENIVFHMNAQNSFEPEEEGEVNLEKQREIEQYRRKFEEALVKIEDKEDVIALQQAKREIDEEFDEEALNPDGTSRAETNAEVQEEAKAEEGNEKDSKTAQELYKEMKRSEFINWRTHPTLNEVTKQSIQWYEENYSFNSYLEDRSKKDSKFVHPLEEEEKNGEKKEDEEGEEEGESDFSMSEEEESDNELQAWNRRQAEGAYSATRTEIQSRYFVV